MDLNKLLENLNKYLENKNSDSAKIAELSAEVSKLQQELSTLKFKQDESSVVGTSSQQLEDNKKTYGPTLKPTKSSILDQFRDSIPVIKYEIHNSDKELIEAAIQALKKTQALASQAPKKLEDVSNTAIFKKIERTDLKPLVRDDSKFRIKFPVGTTVHVTNGVFKDRIGEVVEFDNYSYKVKDEQALFLVAEKDLALFAKSVGHDRLTPQAEVNSMRTLSFTDNVTDFEEVIATDNSKQDFFERAGVKPLDSNQKSLLKDIIKFAKESKRELSPEESLVMEQRSQKLVDILNAELNAKENKILSLKKLQEIENKFNSIVQQEKDVIKHGDFVKKLADDNVIDTKEIKKILDSSAEKEEIYLKSVENMKAKLDKVLECLKPNAQEVSDEVISKVLKQYNIDFSPAFIAEIKASIKKKPLFEINNNFLTLEDLKNPSELNSDRNTLVKHIVEAQDEMYSEDPASAIKEGISYTKRAMIEADKGLKVQEYKVKR